MRSLVKCILEKLSIDDINIVKVSEFPYGKTIDDVERWLIENGFKEETYAVENHGKRERTFNNMHTKCWAYPQSRKDRSVISFANTSKYRGKISERNPMFHIFISRYSTVPKMYYQAKWENVVQDLSLEEFKEKLKNIL